MEDIKKGTPKDVFLHLLSTFTLYVSVVSFITLWWQYINVRFPDVLQGTINYALSSVYGPIRWAMAALIIVFPIHVLISWLIGREFKINPERRDIRVRKWLWYITLFISAVTIIIDLITLLYNFLNGDLTTQFFLKTIVILIVASAVFGYYLWDLREKGNASNKPRLMAWVVSIILLASIIYGFFLIGTPATQRQRRFDEQRVNDLTQIQSEIINYWQQKSVLPVTLNDLKNSISGFTPPLDPETNQPYEYITSGINWPVGQLLFELCSTFKTSTMNGGGTVPSSRLKSPIGAYYPYQQNWNHGVGRACFDRTIDPQIYKSYPSGAPIPLKY